MNGQSLSRVRKCKEPADRQEEYIIQLREDLLQLVAERMELLLRLLGRIEQGTADAGEVLNQLPGMLERRFYGVQGHGGRLRISWILSGTWL